MAHRSTCLLLLLLLATALLLLLAPANAQHRRAASLFSRMKQQGGKGGDEPEPVTAAEPEEGGIRFERRSLALADTPGFSMLDKDLQMIKCVTVRFRVCGAGLECGVWFPIIFIT